MFGAIASAIGGIFGGLFGYKKKQAEVIESAYGVLNNVESTEAARVAAVSQIISAEAKTGGLAAQWRPLLMLSFGIIILASFFGYTPPLLDKPMSPMLQEIFNLLKLGIGGYIGGRSLEKISDSFNLGRVLTKLIEKKLL